MKYVIIGGVASGASFACRLRRLDENCEIVIYEKTNFVSYANCGLPYYISSTIESQDSLTLQTPASLKSRLNIDVKTNSEVVEVLNTEHKIRIKNRKTAEIFTDSYDKLIIATGAEAIKIAPLSDKIFELKTVEDASKIKRYIIGNKVKSAIVIGGGFIGLEILENLAKLNIKVTLIEAQNHCLANLDSEMATLAHNEITKHGIDLKLKTFVMNVSEDKDKVKVSTDKGEFTSEILIQAIGVKPASELANGKLDLGLKNSIKVNSNFTTSDPDIFAIGDVTSCVSEIDNSETYIPLAGLANKEGKELANFLINKEEMAIRALGTSILKLFDLSIASTGFNEAQLKTKKLEYGKIYLTPANHATYYPGSKALTIKVLFDKKSYEILGAQIIGEEGVDKRIDLLAAMMKFKIKGYELKNLELSYAPPFGSAKDPINMVGYMIENIKNNLVKQFYAEDIESIKNNPNCMLVDVRTKAEFEAENIEGSINIPIDELRENLAKIDKNKEICLICLSAIRSYIACRILTQKGYKCSHLAGGFKIYKLYKNII